MKTHPSSPRTLVPVEARVAAVEVVVGLVSQGGPVGGHVLVAEGHVDPQVGAVRDRVLPVALRQGLALPVEKYLVQLS